MIKAVVIDDEHLSRKTIINLVEDLKYDVTLIGEANNVENGIKLIHELNPDLVFLDIEMPDGTGFDLLKKIQNINFHIIFTTAFDNYAIEAFQFSAVNYLLKPIARESFYKAINQTKERLLITESVKKMQATTLIDNYENKKNNLQKVVLPDKDGYLIKPINEIIRLEGQGNYTKIIFTDSTHFLSSYSISHFSDFLEKRGFFRIFKSHLINLDYVVRYSNQDGGKVIMNDGAELRISPTKKEQFKNIFS